MVYRCDRDFAITRLKRGGGVLIACRSKYSVEELSLDDLRQHSTKVDIVRLKLNFGTQSLKVYVL